MTHTPFVMADFPARDKTGIDAGRTDSPRRYAEAYL
jgi:hypothetical protein